MKTWKCATGIDWRISSLQHGITANNSDGLSTISIFDTQDGLSKSLGTECSQTLFVNDQNDIQLKSNASYGTILHEFGHSHGLAHSRPGPDGVVDVMQPGSYDGNPAPPQANVITTDDLDGATKVADNSVSFPSGCGDAIDFEMYGDYSMRDNPKDTGKEPNCEAGPLDNLDVYNSPDLWNCHDALGCGGQNEQPIEGTINHLWANIKNISSDCIASSGIVKFYWTIASTGEIWPNDWISSTQGSCTVGDYIGFSNIGSLMPNEVGGVTIAWTPPNINALIDCEVYRYPWDIQNETYQICLLARINDYKDYMFLEWGGAEIGTNARNSNNIVTKNTKLLDDPNQIINPGTDSVRYQSDVSWFLFRNNNDTTRSLDLVFETVSDASNVDFQYIELLISDELFGKLDEGNMGYSVVAPNVIRLSGFLNEFSLSNIEMDADEKQLIGIRVSIDGDSTAHYNSVCSSDTIIVHHRAADSSKINISSKCYMVFPDFSTGSGTDSQTTSVYELQERTKRDIASVTIYSIVGRFVLNKDQFSDYTMKEIRNELSPGLYIAEFFDEFNQIVKTEKIVVLMNY